MCAINKIQREQNLGFQHRQQMDRLQPGPQRPEQEQMAEYSMTAADYDRFRRHVTGKHMEKFVNCMCFLLGYYNS